jgi:hypothetical protein
MQSINIYPALILSFRLRLHLSSHKYKDPCCCWTDLNNLLCNTIIIALGKLIFFFTTHFDLNVGRHQVIILVYHASRIRTDWNASRRVLYEYVQFLAITPLWFPCRSLSFYTQFSVVSGPFSCPFHYFTFIWYFWPKIFFEFLITPS